MAAFGNLNAAARLQYNEGKTSDCELPVLLV